MSGPDERDEDSEQLTLSEQDSLLLDHRHEGRENYDMDIDRMVNEGLGGGQVTLHNGHIGESTTDTMEESSEMTDISEDGVV